MTILREKVRELLDQGVIELPSKSQKRSSITKVSATDLWRWNRQNYYLIPCSYDDDELIGHERFEISRFEIEPFVIDIITSIVNMRYKVYSEQALAGILRSVFHDWPALLFTRRSPSHKDHMS